MSGINFDLLLEEIGGFGRFQKLAIASLSTVQIFLAFANFGFVFFGYAPTEFHCVEPPYNVTGCQPFCRRYESEDGYFSYAIEWQLMCHSKYLLRLAQIAHMAGLFFGAFTCGALADRFGRLRVLYISLGTMCILSFMTIWITNISSFCVVTFLLGICCQGCGLTSYTIILETVDEKHRALCGILEQIFYAFGIALTALLAYYFLDWRNLAKVFATCGPIAFVCMLPFHIESARWLLVQPNRRAAALKNLNYIARINGTLGSTKLNGLGNESRITSLLKSLSHEGLRATENVGLVKDTEPLIDNVDKKVVVKQRSIQREGCCTLCLHPLLRKWMLIFSVCWFSNAAAYYGSTIASGEAFANRFLSFALSGLIEIPGHCLSPRLMNTCGRRKFHSYLQMLGGAFFLLVPLMGSWHEAAVLTVATFAKLCISMSFASAYVYTSEAYPTSISNSAVGFCVTAGRLGGTIAPAFLLLEFRLGMTMAMLAAFLDAPLRRVPKRTLTKAALKLEPNFVHTNPPGPSENHTGADSADSSTMETPPISPNDLLPVKFTQVAISDWLPTNLCRTPLSWSKIAGHLWDESLVPYIWRHNADKRSGGAPPAGDSRTPDARLLIPNHSEDLSHSFPLRHHHYPCLSHHPLPPLTSTTILCYRSWLIKQ